MPFPFPSEDRPTIRTVIDENGKWGTHHQLCESRCQLLDITLFRRRSILDLCFLLQVRSLDHVVETRRRRDTHILWLITSNRLEPSLQRFYQPFPRRSRVPAENDSAGLRHVDLQLGDQASEGLEQVGRRFRIGEQRRVLFPRCFEHFAAGIYELGTVVDSRVVRCGDHDANRLAIEFLGTKDGEETNPKEGRFQGVTSEKAWSSVSVG